MEQLLHYIWKLHLLPARQLLTTDGRVVEVVDVGQHNNNQGPDFFNAKVAIDGVMWAGNVELHILSSDWYRHGHDQDPGYQNTILHVVQRADVDVVLPDGRKLPQLELEIPGRLKAHYADLLKTTDYPRCHGIISQIPLLKAHLWMDSLLVDRLKERSAKVLERLEDTSGDWERTTFVTLARNFGFGLNGDAFEMWARRVPVSAIAKHRDNLLQVEAMFLGIAGLLDRIKDDEAVKLGREYAFLKNKFALTESSQDYQWKFMRARPQNHPEVRIRQLAFLYHQGNCSMRFLLEAENTDSIRQVLKQAGISQTSCNLIIINTVVPLLYAYGMKNGIPSYCDRAIALLEELPAEDNYILRQWKTCGLEVKSAADSQALIQLKREYCDRLDCLRCRFGYEYLKV